METVKLRRTLIRQFGDIIRNDDKLFSLRGGLDSLETTNRITEIPNEHYKLLKENREKYLNGEMEGMSCEEVRRSLESKYGL